MASARRQPLSLVHLFAAPLVRETVVLGRDDSDPGLVAVKQQNYARERDVITSTLTKAKRCIEFRSKVASEHNFLMSFTGCRVLHFTWNGDGDQEQVMFVFEDKRGYASLVTEEWFQDVCDRRRETLPEVVVLTAASAKLVAGAFIRAGISNVVAVETSDANVLMDDFVCAFYTNLAQGCTLRDSFDAGVRSLPRSEWSRVVLLPENVEHLVSPFDDAKMRSFTDNTLHLPRMVWKAGPASFRGREAKVQEVYMLMVQRIKVITIKGKPGIGKTQVALRACAYAWERHLFGDIFFVSLQDQTTGAPITALKEVAARIGDALGISERQIMEHPEGFLGCIQQKCSFSEDDLLLVLDGCSPSFVHENKGERINLSSVVEQLCQRVSKLQYIVTVVTQVGIAKEKMVNIGRLSNLAAAELFVASAPREVTVNELRGGLDVSGPQVQDAECMRLFAGSDIMSALGGHPGAIVAASSMLKDRHLLRHEDEYLRTISANLERYETLEGEFARQLQGCPQTQSDFDWIERIWGGRHARQKISRRPPEPGRRRETPRPPILRPDRPKAAPVNPAAEDQFNGEFWWKRAVEKHAGGAGAVSQTIPWEALCTHSLAEYFIEVLGEEGRYRPLRNEEFHTLGNNIGLWQPHPPPGSRPGAIVDQQGFLGSFWPWFKATTLLLKRTGYWGCRRYPVICGLTTTSEDGEKLLQGRPIGTFLLRVSSNPGALVVVYVKQNQQVESILVKDPNEKGQFKMEYITRQGIKIMRASLASLILFIDRWTHLFPDTPKKDALGSWR